MKKTAMLFFSISMGIVCHAQNLQKDRMATFPGGNDALNRYVIDHINYPKTAQDSKLEGIVYVSFEVEKDGTVDNVEIIHGVASCPDMDKEAKRLVTTMPKWYPGLDDGKPYISQFEVPIQFQLSKNNLIAAQ